MVTVAVVLEVGHYEVQANLGLKLQPLNNLPFQEGIGDTPEHVILHLIVIFQIEVVKYATGIGIIRAIIIKRRNPG